MDVNEEWEGMMVLENMLVFLSFRGRANKLKPDLTHIAQRQ